MDANRYLYDRYGEIFHSPHPYLASGLAAAFLICAAVVARGAYVEYRDGTESPNWPVTPGKIDFSEGEERNNHGKKETLITFDYCYEVGGITYHTKRFQDSFPTLNEAGLKNDKRWEKYKTGYPCEIHCRPEDPRNAVLQPGLAPNFVMPMVLSIGFVAGLGGLILYKALSDFRRLSDSRRSAQLFEEFKIGPASGG